MNNFLEYMNRFVNDQSAYLTQQKDGSYRAVYETVTLDLIALHLKGEITIAFPAATTGGVSKWICFDDDNVLLAGQSGVLDQLATHLTKCGYSFLREGMRVLPGGSIKQGHLWVFLDRPIRSHHAHAWALRMLREINLIPPIKSLEIFPKDNKTDKIAAGVRGPLGRHAKAEGKFIWLQNLPQNLEAQMAYVLSIPPNNADRIEFLGSKELELIAARSRFRRTCRNRVLLKFSPERVFADLQPQCKDGYFICKCPKCGEREAYFYERGSLLSCNRQNKCGFKISIRQYLAQLSKGV